jgi:hypothetical protein
MQQHSGPAKLNMLHHLSLVPLLLMRADSAHTCIRHTSLTASRP